MSRRYYTDQEKSEVLEHLFDNFGNVTLTALQTGIPKRTIYDWRREDKLRRLQNGEPIRTPPQTKNSVLRRKNADDEGETNADETLPEGEYANIRYRLMKHLDNLIETLTDDPDTAHLRISAVSRLLDRVVKLEALAFKQGPSTIRIEYVYPDGKIYDRPIWENEEVYNELWNNMPEERRPPGWSRIEAEEIPPLLDPDTPTEPIHKQDKTTEEYRDYLRRKELLIGSVDRSYNDDW